MLSFARFSVNDYIYFRINDHMHCIKKPDQAGRAFCVEGGACFSTPVSNVCDSRLVLLRAFA